MQVFIEPSAAIRRDYNYVADLCISTGQPVFLTKNGAGDMVAVSFAAFFEKERQIGLREELVRIEKQRRAGQKDLSFGAVCARLYETVEKYKLLPLTEESEYPERGA